jgi:hypothetical protein
MRKILSGKFEQLAQPRDETNRRAEEEAKRSEA